MENQTIGISYGVLCESVSKQLNKQGFKYDKKKIQQFEKELDAIHTLRFGSGLITDSLFEKLLPKLHKKIVSHVAKENKMKVVNNK